MMQKFRIRETGTSVIARAPCAWSALILGRGQRGYRLLSHRDGASRVEAARGQGESLPWQQPLPMLVSRSNAVMTSSTSPEAAASDSRALTLENVERTLDELRPYLMADGGNVEVVEIDGPVVKVRLQGACGSCPSSTMTLKMGIERKLREAIPEVSEVVQVL